MASLGHFRVDTGIGLQFTIKIPFFRDFAVNVRFLIALPILILAESSIDQRWRILVLQFLKLGLLDEKELHSFEDAIESTTRLRDRWLPEVVNLIAALLPSIFITNTESFMNGVSSWHTLSVQPVELSLAGWWFNLLACPSSDSDAISMVLADVPLGLVPLACRTD